MTVTTTFSLDDAGTIQLLDDTGTNQLAELDLTTLSDGRMIFAGDNLENGAVDFGVSGFGSAIGHAVGLGHDAHIDQLKNGDLVVSSELDGDVQWAVIDATGSVAKSGSYGGGQAGQTDATALRNGGFVVTDQLTVSGEDKFIDVSIHNSNGAEVKTFTIDSSVATDENASVTTLRDGGFAVAWDQDSGTHKDGFFAIYEADGSLRFQGALPDSAGDQSHMSAVGLAKGGFAVAYVEADRGGADNIFVAIYTASGDLEQLKNVSQGGVDGHDDGANSEPCLTVLQDGTLAVSWTHVVDAGDTDIYMQLLNPKTGQLLEPAAQAVVGFDGLQHASSIAASGDSQIVVGYEDGNTGGAAAVVVQPHVVHEGDAATNQIFGGIAFDTIDGEGGHDGLKGGGGDDTIDGGGGSDIINGGEGHDLMTGGAGHDTFIFSAIVDIDQGQDAAGDVITDLTSADKIDLSGIDANTAVAGDQAFVLVQHFTGQAGQMTLSYDAASNQTELSVDVNGDGLSDGGITLQGDHADFVHFVL